jgi:hypothetical protein
MITDLALTGVAIVVFLIMAGLAWRPFQRRHIDRPLPTDPAAQAANIGGIIGGGCIVLAFAPSLPWPCWPRCYWRWRLCHDNNNGSRNGDAAHRACRTAVHAEEDDTLRRLAAEGHTRRQIADAMGRQYHSVRHRGDLLGIAFLAYAPGRGEPSPCRTAAAVQFCYRPPPAGRMAIYADGVPMTTDRLLGLMALAIGGALAWFVFEPVMSATAAHGVNADTLITAVVLLLGVLVGWAVVDHLRR